MSFYVPLKLLSHIWNETHSGPIPWNITIQLTKTDNKTNAIFITKSNISGVYENRYIVFSINLGTLLNNTKWKLNFTLKYDTFFAHSSVTNFSKQIKVLLNQSIYIYTGFVNNNWSTMNTTSTTIVTASTLYSTNGVTPSLLNSRTKSNIKFYLLYEFIRFFMQTGNWQHTAQKLQH